MVDVTRTFGQLESLLAIYIGIDPEKRTAFQARLKNFHRLGYPADLKTVKGRPTIYHPRHTIRMALALQLSQMGLPPERCVKLLTDFEHVIALAVGNAAAAIIEKPAGWEKRSDLPESHFLTFDPMSFAPLMHQDALDQYNMRVAYEKQQFAEGRLVANTYNELGRLALINVTATMDFISPSHSQSPQRRRAFLEDCAAWFTETWEARDGNP